MPQPATPRPTIDTAADAYALLRDAFRSALGERLSVAYLDGSRRLMLREEMEGEVCRVTVPIRTLLRQALALDARYMVLAHNHPSGQARPSRADLVATRMLVEAARPLGIRIADHLVFAGDGCASFRQLKLL